MSGLLRRGIYFGADNGAGGSGGGVVPQPGQEPVNNPGQGDSKDGNAPGPKGEGGEEKLALTAKEIQDRIDAAVKDRLDRAKKKAEADAAKVKSDAETAQLEQNKEWEKLAGTQKARITELEGQVKAAEALTAERDRYKTALDGYVKAAKADLPAHILKLLEKLDPVDQLTYITENAAALKPSGVGTGQGDARKGPPASPTSNKGQQPADEDARSAQQRVLYNRF